MASFMYVYTDTISRPGVITILEYVEYPQLFKFKDQFPITLEMQSEVNGHGTGSDVFGDFCIMLLWQYEWMPRIRDDPIPSWNFLFIRKFQMTLSLK